MAVKAGFWNSVKAMPSVKKIIASFWRNNPISVQIIGICSALAVTAKLETAITMSIALTLVVTLASGIISALRGLIPHNIRMIAQMAVIATLVIIIDELLRAYFYDISKQMSIFVGLIMTNCIVQGRAEAFAMHNPPRASMLDGFASGVGYSFILICVGFLRELLGSGQLLGFKVVPQWLYNLGYQDNGLMLLAPGAFIIIGLFVWLQYALCNRKTKRG